MPKLTIEQTGQLIDAIADLARLASLDSIWTAYLDQHPSVPSKDNPPLNKLASEMDGLLARCESHGKFLGRLIKDHSEELEDSFQKLRLGTLQGSPLIPGSSKSPGVEILTDEQRDAFLRFVERRGGIVKTGDSVAKGLVEAIPAERKEIASKLASISAGKATTGDLSKGMVCSIAGNMVVGGLLGIETGVGAFIGAAGCVILLAAEAAGNPC